MATSPAEFRNLVSNYKSITAASRAAGNADPAIKGQLEGLQSQLAPYVAEGYSAGGYDDAASISKDITSYINLIDTNIANGKTPEPKQSETNQPPAATTPPATSDNKQKDDAKTENATTVAGKSDASNNDSKNSTTNASTGTGPNKRTWNPLGDFSSYTYRISLYSMPPEALNTYVRTGRFSNEDLYLIVQSGGSNEMGIKTDKSGNTTFLDAKRGTGFDLDFYIDDLEIETLTNAKENGISSNSVNFKFKVIEPYGMSFPTKLVSQQIELQNIANMKRPVKDQIEALAGHYLLSIRFYGYDENGQITTSAMYGGSAQDGMSAALLDSDATFERNFPILINKFNFRLDGKSTVYDINAKLVAEQVALGAKRGLVVEGIKVVGATVGEMIGGNGGTEGLLDKLNSAQQTLVNEKKSQAIADVFEVMYENEDIKQSSVVDENQINKDRVPMADVTLGGAVKTSVSPASKTMQKSRTISFSAGLPLTQAIDQIVTQSKFITDALTYVESEETQAPQEGEPTAEDNAKPKTIQWYIVAPTVSVLGWDDLRNDYAYKTTFVIKKYEIPYVKSGNVKNVAKYPGPHKIYNYWYTGKNSEVISYEQQYNLLYFNAAALADKKSGIDPDSTTPIYQRAAISADSTSKAAGSFEAINTVKTFLYSPGDQLHAKIRILGDPDFLMPATCGNAQEIMRQWYGEDFTINPNSGQVFIELIFKQVEDYTHSDGLINPNDNIDFWDYSENPGMAAMVKGMVYMILKVTSRFSRGLFTQDLKTVLPNFNDMATNDKKNASSQRAESKPAAIAANPNKTAETAGRTGVNLTNTSSGGGRGTVGGPTAEQAAKNKGLINYKPVKHQVVNMGSKPDDDMLIVTGPTYKKEFKQANFYNGELEREHAKTSDPANKTSRYSGLNGREAYNPANDPRRTDRR